MVTLTLPFFLPFLHCFFPPSLLSPSLPLSFLSSLPTVLLSGGFLVLSHPTPRWILSAFIHSGLSVKGTFPVWGLQPPYAGDRWHSLAEAKSLVTHGTWA